MCVIAVSPKGVAQPSESRMREMWDANPHGAGYMTVRKGVVEIHKGFMSIDDFLRAVRAEAFTADDPVVYHFRISTQGGVNPQMTHPFPLTDELSAMKWLDLTCGCGIAHNGIIPCCSTPECKSTGYSDTALFVADYLTKLIPTHRDVQDPKRIAEVERLAKSKLAILEKTGDITTVGRFTNENGILYSNDYFKPRRFSFRDYKPASKYKAYGAWWDDDDEFYWG